LWPAGRSSNALALDDILAYQRDFWERAILFFLGHAADSNDF
jgi:hypothetical protein